METQDVAAQETPEVTAQAGEETAATAAAESDAAPQQAEQQQDKTFTQAELDAILQKRLARERRAWERDQTTRAAVQQQQQQAPQVRPADQYQSPEQYAEALAVAKAQEIVAARDAQREAEEILAAYHDREEDARNKYDDFEQVAYNPTLRITDVMAQTIQASDIGPEIAYHLGLNRAEAERISRLPPIQQAREIGKLEARLATDPPAPKQRSTAPPPVSPVTPRTSSAPAYDTTDPRACKTMSTSDWIEADRKRMEAKLRAKGYT